MSAPRIPLLAILVALLLVCTCAADCHAQQTSGQQQQQQQQSQPQPSIRPVAEVRLTHGILRPLPRQYQPPQPEPIVAPAVGSHAHEELQPVQQRTGEPQREAKGQTAAGREGRDAQLSPEEPHHISKDPLVEQLKEEIKHLHHRLHGEHDDFTKTQVHVSESSRSGVPEQLSPEEPHRIVKDPLVEQLKDEIKHLHHRLHHEKHLTPFEAEMYAALDKVLAKIKSRQEHVAEVQAQVDLLRNLTQQMLTTPTKLDAEVLEAASKLLQICSSSADISHKPPTRRGHDAKAREAPMQPHREMKPRSVQQRPQQQPAPHPHTHPHPHEEESDFVELMPAPHHREGESAEERRRLDEDAYGQAYERARRLRLDQRERRKHLHPPHEKRHAEKVSEAEPRWLESERRRRMRPHRDEPDAHYHEPGEDDQLAAFRRVAVEPLRRGWAQISEFARDRWWQLQDDILPLRGRGGDR